MTMGLDYLIAALLSSLPWLLIFAVRPDLGPCLLYMSLLCMPLGASDLVFIPHSWTPATLFGWVPGGRVFSLPSTQGGLRPPFGRSYGAGALHSSQAYWTLP
jgi:hypothetical protein